MISLPFATRLVTALAALGVLVAPLIVYAVQPLASVRFIQHGLTVDPPRRLPAPGRVGQGLYDSYALRTQAGQKASLRFADGSALQMNERTGLVLRSRTPVSLTRGEVNVNDLRGTHHDVRSATAVAAALGTDYDVRITPPSAPSLYPPPPPGGVGQAFPPGTTTVSVVTGAVIVSNRFGRRRVRANQWTHVLPGKAPTPPTSHNARADISWTKGLP